MNTYTLSAGDALKAWSGDTAYDKIFLFCDQHTALQCYPRLELPSNIKLIIVPPGEGSKNLITARTVWTELAQAGATRKSLMMNLGGGTITDIGGFTASTFQRGIDFVNVPTTLLAMVDASIGGKTGINLGELKNYIGTFSLPVATITDPGFLATLPDTEMTNGLAEIIKHGALAGNALWDIAVNAMPRKDQPAAWLPIIRANADYKLSVTSEDFRESSVRQRLNFGHTAGHALEALYLSGGVELPHGQAVAAGMWIETIAARELGLTTGDFPEHLEWIIRQHFQAVRFSPGQIGELMAYALKDKKSHGQKIICSLVSQPGYPTDAVEVPGDVMNRAFGQYLNETGQTV